MVRHKSQEKRNRQDEALRLHNRHWRATIRTSVKAVREAVEAGKKKEAAEALPTALSLLDKSGTKGIAHKRTVARTKSRLTRAVQNLP